jgi:signal transduction histidine kinase
VPVYVADVRDPESLHRALNAGAGPEAMLRELLRALGRAVHDANNPLTVITGNAQYALEMARSLDVDASLVRSVEDIEEAGRRLESAMAALSEVRRRLAAAIETGDRVA